MIPGNHDIRPPTYAFRNIGSCNLREECRSLRKSAEVATFAIGMF